MGTAAGRAVYWHKYIMFPSSRALGVNQWEFIYSVVCLTTCPQPLPKRVRHTVRSSASSCNFQYPLFSLTSSSSRLRLLSRLPLTSIIPSIFPSITCFRRQFIRKMWPIQLVFLLFIEGRIFLSSLIQCNRVTKTPRTSERCLECRLYPFGKFLSGHVIHSRTPEVLTGVKRPWNNPFSLILVINQLDAQNLLL